MARTKKAETAAVTVEAEAPAKKPAAKRAPRAPKTKVVLEYKGVQVDLDDVLAAVRADWTGETTKTLEVYLKPEDGAAYYVVNGGEAGKISL